MSLSKQILIVFDLDGTLVQLDFTQDGMVKARKQLQQIFSVSGIQSEFKPLHREVYKVLKSPEIGPDNTYSDELRSSVFDVLRGLEQDAVTRLTHYPDAIECYVQCVADPTISTAIATNNTCLTAKTAIDYVGVPHPDTLVSIEDVQLPKPDPHMLNLVLNRHANAMRLIMIGDRYSDIQSAQKASSNHDVELVSILIDRFDSRRENQQDVEFIFPSFADIDIYEFVD